MARKSFVDDSAWPEVVSINSYAVFKGYLLMGIRGLGLLIVAWNTAVLLGGFVPNLERTDFWCLTAIGLIQAVGVVDFFHKEKLTELSFRIFHKLRDLFGKIAWRSLDRNGSMLIFRLRLVFKILGYLILMCLLAPVPVLGLYISAGISTWRLIEHNYGSGGGSANLKPAVYGLYSLAVAQGVLYGYKTIDAIGTRINLAKSVARRSLVDRELVLAYLDNMVAGCKKDPSFATERNFVTYAVYLMMESTKSNGGNFIDGIRLLGQVIEPDYPRGRLVLAKHLLTRSASFPHLIQRLLETLGSRSPYNREIREYAARIVALVARSIHLEQFPRGIQCISSLLLDDEFHESEPGGHLPKEYERGWLLEKFERDYLVLELERHSPPGVENNPLLGYARLVIQGLQILEKLTVDEDNCRQIINTQGLLSKITRAPLISNQLHKDHHDEWCNMVEESLELMSRLLVAAPETETKLRGEISSNMGAIVVTLESILECSECSLLEKRKAIEILLLLDPPEAISSLMASASSSTTFKWILIVIFLLSQNSYIRRLAGEKLQSMSSSLQSEGSATRIIMLQSSVGVVLGDLTTTIADGNHEDRVHAAQILVHLCLNYTNDNEYLKQLKQAIVEVMPKVLKQIFGYATREEIRAVTTEVNNGQFSVPSKENGEQNKGSKLQEALIFLCWTIWIKWYNVSNPGITRQLDEIAAQCSEQGKPVKRFGELVVEARGLLKKMNQGNF